MADSRRFQHHLRQEINEKKVTSTPKNTIKANAKAARALRAYLDESKEYDDVNFESLTAEKLNEVLEGFWLAARKQKQCDENKQGFYKASTLENLRHSLNRYLKAPPNNRDFDIIKDKEFNAANESFKAALRELKNIGKGEVSHHPEIAEADLQQLYSNFSSTSDPLELQEKVQFDIRFYFFRRGAENMHGMTKSTFVIKTDVNTGRRFVCKAIDELNKNHNELDRESYTAMMPELPGNSRCPVTSFETYLQHLNPNCDKLWHRPREKINLKVNDQVWFYNKCLGIDMLQSFMKKLSLKYKLSQIYTNHSVRVTGATILSRKKYASSQIQAVTGHKSVSSLAIYQRVSDKEKMEMGKSLSETLVGPEFDFETTRSPKQVGTPSSNTCRHAVGLALDQDDAMPLQTVDLNDLGDLGLQFGLSQPSMSRPGPSSTCTSDMPRPSSTSTISTPPVQLQQFQTPTLSNPQQVDELQACKQLPQSPTISQQGQVPMDFSLSPLLRDLEDDPFFEQQTQEIHMTNTAGNQVITTAQRNVVSLRSPRQRSSTLPSFSGCTIHNLVVNVYPHH
jgi:hypothetical protein